MALKVCIIPRWQGPDKAEGGIRRVVEAQEKYLPQFGIELVHSSDEADVLHTHGTAWFDRRADKPVVNSSHGMMWSKYDWPAWAHHVNYQCVEAMIRAQFHTAPSEWVARALRRGMMIYPEVVHHGIDADEWKPSEDGHQDYVLWNKAREDAVSDPEDMVKLARLLPDHHFVSTIRPKEAPQNVEQVGVMPVQEMREFVRHAGLYLATARETFGIGTLEAMSCGVPVVGWDWGGQSEIVKHGETGFLAKPGDYAALAEGIGWALSERRMLSENARQDILDRWGWEKRIEQYARLYEKALAWWKQPEVKVSVVVTTHNLARYLGDCLDSVAGQGFKDWECIVVDDASEDQPDQVARTYDSRFRFIRSDQNLKLPGARNHGFELSRGRYVIFLDADDMLAPNALEVLSEQLDLDPGIHIAYGHLDTVREDGSGQKRNDWPWDEFSWRAQLAHLNQLPYAAMMRREVLERTGGYRKRHWRNEDAPFWILASSFGFRIKKVTKAATLIYRVRSDSKTQKELKNSPEGDWTSWFPWRLGAATPQEGFKLWGRKEVDVDIVPFSAQGKPAPGRRFWLVPDHAEPKISVLIPVGPGHEQYVIDALESVRAQTFQNWECIVVNATGKRWESGFRSPVQGCPWAQIVTAPRPMRPSEARNLAALHARADAILWLDADDILLPHALEEMYAWYVGTGGLIYTDWLKAENDPLEPMQPFEAWDFRCGDVLKKMRHAMMVLMPRAKHDEIGGYDETFSGWEDWDYLIALQAAGLCSYRVPTPGFVYRFRTGTIREDSFSKKEQILEQIRAKWADYYEGRKAMPCGSCPGGARAKINPTANPSAQIANSDIGAIGPTTLLAYQGPSDGKVRLRGPITGTLYTFHPNAPKYVLRDDAEVFLNRYRNGKPDFLIVEKQKPQIKVAVEFEGPAQRPEFPEMPGPDPRKAEDMTIAELSAAAVDATPTMLLQWLQQEQAGKNRKGAVRVLEEALESEPDTIPA